MSEIVIVAICGAVTSAALAGIVTICWMAARRIESLMVRALLAEGAIAATTQRLKKTEGALQDDATKQIGTAEAVAGSGDLDAVGDNFARVLRGDPFDDASGGASADAVPRPAEGH